MIHCERCGVSLTPTTSGQAWIGRSDLHAACLSCGESLQPRLPPSEGFTLKLIRDVFKADGAIFFADEYWQCWSTRPADPAPRAELQLVADGKHWKLPYNRIEQLVEQGYVNATMTRLTEKGRRVLA